jgi:hypothetical protein
MARKMKSIEMLDGLPRYADDDVEWICRNLGDISPQSIAGFMQRMHIETRSMSGSGPSPAYYRIAAAFKRGEGAGRLMKGLGRKSWRVAAKAA